MVERKKKEGEGEEGRERQSERDRKPGRMTGREGERQERAR